MPNICYGSSQNQYVQPIKINISTEMLHKPQPPLTFFFSFHIINTANVLQLLIFSYNLKLFYSA